MKIVLLTGADVQHRYVANRLSQVFELAAIVVDQGAPTSRITRLRRLWKKYTIPQAIGRGCVRILRQVWNDRRHRAAQLRRILGEDALQFERTDLLRYVRGLNTPETMKAVAAIDPDLLLVFGTGIVKNELLLLARRVALNLHTGISPYYRGGDCTFWPLHNGEPHMVGATVHQCTASVDGGAIYAIGRPRLHADDCLFSVYARCVVVGADLYIHVVDQILNGTVEAQAQDHNLGREFKAADRGLRAELRVRHLIRKGLLRQYAHQPTPEPRAVEN